MTPPARRLLRRHPDDLIVGLVSISDRASRGDYQDEGLPALQTWLQATLVGTCQFVQRLIADERTLIERTLIELVDEVGCDLVLTTGGTGPSRRDVTPEATLAVATREMPGFGEQMRRISLNFVPTAILSRQVAVLREVDLIAPAEATGHGTAAAPASATSGTSSTAAAPASATSEASSTAHSAAPATQHAALIINLPGQPKAIRETLEGLRAADGTLTVPGIFAAVPYCIDLIGGPYIDTHESVIAAFRPKSARRAANVPPGG